MYGADSTTVATLKLRTETEGTDKIGHLGNTIGNVTKIAAGLGTALLGGGIAVTKIASDFEAAQTHVLAFTSVTQKQMEGWTTETGKHIDGFRDKILALGPTVGKSSTELMEGFYSLASAGLKPVDSMSALEVSAKAAGAAQADMTDVTKAATAVINTYHLTGAQIPAMMDQMMKSVNMGSAEFKDIATSIGGVIPVAKQLGVPFSQVAALMADLTNKGNTAAESSDMLRNMFQQLLSPTEQQVKMMDALNISMTDIDVKHKGLLPVIKNMQTALKDSGPDEMAKRLGLTGSKADEFKAKVATTNQQIRLLFGGNQVAMRTFLSEFSEGTAGASKMMDATAHSAGELDRSFSKAMDSTQAQFDRLKSAAQNVAIQIGSVALPMVKEAFKGLADFLSAHVNDISSVMKGLGDAVGPALKSGFDTAKSVISSLFTFLSEHKTQIADFAKSVGGLLSDLGTGASNVGSFLKEFTSSHAKDIAAIASSVGDFAKSVGDAVRVIGTFTGETMSAFWTEVNKKKNLDDLAKSIRGVGDALAPLTGAFGDLGTALNGIFGDDSAGGKATKRSTELGHILADVLPVAVDGLGVAISAMVTPISLFVKGLAAIIETGTPVVKFLITLGRQVAETAQAIVKKAQDIRDGFTSALSDLPGKVMGIFGDLRDKILNWIGNRKDDLTSAGGTFLTALGNGIRGGFQFVTGALGDLKDKILGWIGDRKDDLKNAAGGWMTALRNGIVDGSSTIAEGLKTAIEHAIDGVKGAIGGKLHDLASWIGDQLSKIPGVSWLTGQMQGGAVSIPGSIMGSHPGATIYGISPTANNIGPVMQSYSGLPNAVAHVDYAGDYGQAFSAPGGKNVKYRIYVGYQPGVGNYEIIQAPNGGLETFEHMLSTPFPVGYSGMVTGATTLGRVGGVPGQSGVTSAHSSGAHLHTAYDAGFAAFMASITGGQGWVAGPSGTGGGYTGSGFGGGATGLSYPKAITQYWDLITKAARQTGVDPMLIAAVMLHESGGNMGARGSSGEIGLMQLMPGTAKGLGVNPYSPWGNILGGAKYLAQAERKAGGNDPLALEYYNAGLGARDPSISAGYAHDVLALKSKYGGATPVHVVNWNEGATVRGNGREGAALTPDVLSKWGATGYMRPWDTATGPVDPAVQWMHRGYRRPGEDDPADPYYHAGYQHPWDQRVSLQSQLVLAGYDPTTIPRDSWKATLALGSGYPGQYQPGGKITADPVQDMANHFNQAISKLGDTATKRLGAAADQLWTSMHSTGADAQIAFQGYLQSLAKATTATEKQIDRQEFFDRVQAQMNATVSLAKGRLDDFMGALGTFATQIRERITQSILGGHGMPQGQIDALANIKNAGDAVTEITSGIDAAVAATRTDLDGMGQAVATASSVLERQWLDAIRHGSSEANIFAGLLAQGADVQRAVVHAQNAASVALGLITRSASTLNSGLQGLLSEATERMDFFSAAVGRAPADFRDLSSSLHQAAGEAIKWAENLGSLSSIISGLGSVISGLKEASGTQFARTGTFSPTTDADYRRALSEQKKATWDQVNNNLHLARTTDDVDEFLSGLGDEITLQTKAVHTAAIQYGIGSVEYGRQLQTLKALQDEQTNLTNAVRLMNGETELTAQEQANALGALSAFRQGTDAAAQALAGNVGIIQTAETGLGDALNGAAAKVSSFGSAVVDVVGAALLRIPGFIDQLAGAVGLALQGVADATVLGIQKVDQAANLEIGVIQTIGANLRSALLDAAKQGSNGRGGGSGGLTPQSLDAIGGSQVRSSNDTTTNPYAVDTLSGLSSNNSTITVTATLMTAAYNTGYADGFNMSTPQARPSDWPDVLYANYQRGVSDGQTWKREHPNSTGEELNLGIPATGVAAMTADQYGNYIGVTQQIQSVATTGEYIPVTQQYGPDYWATSGGTGIYAWSNVAGPASYSNTPDAGWYNPEIRYAAQWNGQDESGVFFLSTDYKVFATRQEAIDHDRAMGFGLPVAEGAVGGGYNAALWGSAANLYAQPNIQPNGPAPYGPSVPYTDVTPLEVTDSHGHRILQQIADATTDLSETYRKQAAAEKLRGDALQSLVDMQRGGFEFITTVLPALLKNPQYSHILVSALQNQ